ncbi:MAG: hypothetical protein ACRYGK_04185 [Janthinobacterium lividum]
MRPSVVEIEDPANSGEPGLFYRKAPELVIIGKRGNLLKRYPKGLTMLRSGHLAWKPSSAPTSGLAPAAQSMPAPALAVMRFS